MHSYLFFSSFSIASSISLPCFSFVSWLSGLFDSVALRYADIKRSTVKASLNHSFSVTQRNILKAVNKTTIFRLVVEHIIKRKTTSKTVFQFGKTAFQPSFSTITNVPAIIIKIINIANNASTNPSPLKNPFFTSSPSFIPSIYKTHGGLI